MLDWIALGAGVFQLVSEKGPSLRISGSPAAMLKVCLVSSLLEPGFVAEDDLLLLVSLGLCHLGGGLKSSAHSLEQSILSRPERKREILCLPHALYPIAHASSLNDGKLQTPFLVGTLPRLIGVLTLVRAFVKSSKKEALKTRGHRGWERGP